MTDSTLRVDRPINVVREQEPDAHGNLANVLTVFLTASTCPVGCHMCDLHRFTIPGPIPSGAIADQVRWSLNKDTESHNVDVGQTDRERLPRWIKLYNSGNFFDVASIPQSDYEPIAELVSDFDRVIVENHPRIGRKRVDDFNRLVGGELQVAVGLETVQPRWLNRLGKQMTRDDFDEFANSLREREIGLRVFLICGVPATTAAESLRWTRLSLRHAIHCGAQHVSLIPARPGHGWNGWANRLPEISATVLADLQAESIDQHHGQAAITVDTWDMPNDTGNEQTKLNMRRIDSMNLTQVAG